MPINRLIEFLDKNQIKYERLTHSKAYTAQEAAASAHIPGKEMAKTVIVMADGKLLMAVLPASLSIDFELLKRTIGAADVDLAKEGEFKDIFPDCDIGAMPPFGNLYGMDVYVADKLAINDNIAFNACNHTDMIRMSYADYEKLVKPKIIDFSYSY
jgi:Ala-tRNA(Pro) deacylase